MNGTQTRPDDVIKPLHVVMIVLVGLTLTGSSMLLSAVEPSILVDGAIEWHEESPLRAVVQTLCLNYQVPTIYAGTVKNYILGIGAGLAILCFTIAIGATKRNGEAIAGRDAELPGLPETAGAEPAQTHPKVHTAPLIAAQALVGLYLLWSFASYRWSSAPELALGASTLLTIQFLWAFGIGNSLGPSAARIACQLFVGITAITAIVAIWYYEGRNPALRAKFPYGNPTFLAACLMPAILVTLSTLIGEVAQLVTDRRPKRLGIALLLLGALAVILWALYLTGSRSPLVGLVFGLFGLAFFAVRGRRRVIPVALAIGLSVAGWLYLSSASEAFSPTGRHLTLRLRTYAWSYAWQMFRENPLTGHGQGGFVLAGDSHVVDDVLDDPRVFTTRIAHVHNEWLEVMADLGLIGIVLVTAVIVLTLRAGMIALAALPPPGIRWALLGLMGALIGLVVEECFSVGLRVSGVPTVFFTVIGLIWAISAYGMCGLPHHLSKTRKRCLATTVIGGVLGFLTLATVQQDFRSARSAFRASSAFFTGDYDQAIELASAAPNQLNPQRALTDLYRLGEAHLRRAQRFQERARDRQARAHRTEQPDARLLALSYEDYQFSEGACQDGIHTLNQLIARAPGFLNHGRLAYWLYRTKAGNAAAQSDHEAEKALIQSAAEEIKRELLRQPFEPTLAAYYALVSRYSADAPAGVEELVRVLARPLRHDRLTEAYMDLLQDFARDPEFDGRLKPLVEQASTRLMSQQDAGAPGDKKQEWAPETLRLAAAYYFAGGRYEEARELLLTVAPVYERLASEAPFGAASSLGELAICQFFADPTDPDSALASAQRALAIAPESLRGRQLRAAIKGRMVDYHLSAGREDEATRLLAETAPSGVTDEDVQQQLGVHYRRMCEAMLGRREADSPLRKAPTDLLPRLRSWAGRAIALNPGDPRAHFVTADLAFHSGDDVATVQHLQRALATGFSVDEVVRFLTIAFEKKPGSQPLQTLWTTLTSLPVPSPAGPSGLNDGPGVLELP